MSINCNIFATVAKIPTRTTIIKFLVAASNCAKMKNLIRLPTFLGEKFRSGCNLGMFLEKFEFAI